LILLAWGDALQSKNPGGLDVWLTSHTVGLGPLAITTRPALLHINDEEVDSFYAELCEHYSTVQAITGITVDWPLTDYQHKFGLPARANNCVKRNGIDRI
jgi:hypothetical protein